MADFLEGTWKMTKSENYDQFLSSLGVGFAARKLVGTLTPTNVWSKNAETEEWTFSIVTPLKVNTIKFKVGEEFEEDSLLGKKSKTIIKLEDDGKQVVQLQHDASTNELIAETIRELLEDGTLKVTFKHKEVVATRWFQKV